MSMYLVREYCRTQCEKLVVDLVEVKEFRDFCKGFDLCRLSAKETAEAAQERSLAASNLVIFPEIFLEASLSD